MIFGGLIDDLTGGFELATLRLAQGVPGLPVTSAAPIGQVCDAVAAVVAHQRGAVDAFEVAPRHTGSNCGTAEPCRLELR